MTRSTALILSALVVAAAPRPAVVLEKATFAAGCFWCAEAAFEGLPGVVSVTSGYAGGTEPDPTYKTVSAGATGHAESVQVLFDPKKTTYEELLDTFWHNVDPTTADRQFCDSGRQYRSAIFFDGDAQKAAALASKKAIEEARTFETPLMTEIAPVGRFYPAEEYHQDYYKKNPEDYNAYRMGCRRDQRLKQLWGDKAKTKKH